MTDPRIDEIIESLCCPDDQSSLIVKTKHLHCSKCYKNFPIFTNNFVEILPSNFPAWDQSDNENKKTEKAYQDIFLEPFAWNKKSNGWGYLPDSSPGYRAFVGKEREKIIEFLNSSSDMIGIDVSGGVGNYSIPLSHKVKVMVHCELEVQSILSAYNEGKEKDNMLFLRSPYLKLPFKSESFDLAICTDTLIRGKRHEIMLLTEIYRILKTGGKAVVDFHNARFYRRKSRKSISFYTPEMIKQIFLEARIFRYSMYPLGFIPIRFVPNEDLYSGLDRLFKLFVSPMRYIVVITKA